MNPPSCITAGTKHQVCEDCGTTLEEGVSIPVAGHKYAEGICSVCGAKQGTSGIAYKEYDDYAICTGIGATKDTDIIIDGTYYGKLVTSISAGAFRLSTPSTLTSVVISEGVQRIEFSAFEYCSALTSITIPEGVTSIGYMAFDGCGSLVSITIPAGLTSIGEYGFYSCWSLADITIPESVTNIDANAFYYCEVLTIYCETASKPDDWHKNWNRYGCPVVWNCNNNGVADVGYIYALIDGIRYVLQDDCATVAWQTGSLSGDIVLPETVTYKDTVYSVTSIGEHAFFDCSKLTNITIPSSVTSICSKAFENCSSLASITIPSNVTSIAYYVFHNCRSLTSIVIPETVTSIEGGAFYGCSSLETVTFAGNSQCASIGSYAFYTCRSLTNVTIPASVTSIGEYVFSCCSSLENVTFADNSQCASVDSHAFQYCSKLTSITIPNSVTSIGYYAFTGCSALANIIIPSSITRMGGSVFHNCHSLTIYCEAASLPDSWDGYWNPNNCPVVWGYVADEQ